MLKKIIILIVIFVAGSFLYWNNLNSPVDINGREQVFVIESGASIKQAANNLKKDNLIKSAFYFKSKVESGKNIKAGEYLISPKLSTSEIIIILTSGNTVVSEKSIRIIEGWKTKDIGAYLEKNDIISTNDFLALTNEPISKWKFSFSKPGFLDDAPKTAGLEGFLFPDTYRIFNEAKAEEIIGKMLINFDKKLTPEIREEIKRQKKTIYEIITMASIIEKEVRTIDDMKVVSGLFWNRIKNGMPLQSDAGLSYLLDDKIGGHTIEQTKIDSPYNTYKYRGLPPGPIANPGINAIKAAVYPEMTNYVYFLSDPETGKTIYSRTLDEHNSNKYKYLR